MPVQAEEIIESHSSKSSPVKAKLPEHVAIIMDGNRRWAKKRLLPPSVGHWKGADALADLVACAPNLGIKILTVYAFSTENWTRSAQEVSSLMQLLEIYLEKQKAHMITEGVRLNTIGDLSKLPDQTKKVIDEVKEATKNGDRLELVLALNYGGRDEICRAVGALAEDYKQGKFFKEQISERLISEYLDTRGRRDPDLLIRTSGESRLSNFLLWQISYTEVYITNTLWPDFNEGELRKAISEFQSRERRLGGS